MNNEQSQKLAVLIDADNASADIVEALLEEIAKYGIASVKRIYGDWSSGLKKWKNALLPHAITPVQQFAYTKGKNATDMALVIDAMDLLYSNTFDGFCLVSSDSDFTRLAARLRENGLTVYGFGEKKTPEAFRKACDKFIYTEIFQPARKVASKTGDQRSGDKNAPVAAEQAVNKIDAALLNLLYKAVKESADDLGWAGLGAVGSYVNKVTPDFDARNYGFSKLSNLIKSLPQFETHVDNNQLKIRKTKPGAARVAEAAVATEAPRRRGRPPKAESTVTAQPDAASVTEAVAGSGKRGRPRKNTEVETETKPVKATVKTAAKTATKGRRRKAVGQHFSRFIPLVQQAVSAAAGDDTEGWARLGDVVKQLPHIDPSFQVGDYGFDDVREAIRAIYADWLEIKKIGRGERVRIHKHFVARADVKTEARAETVDGAVEGIGAAAEPPVAMPPADGATENGEIGSPTDKEV